MPGNPLHLRHARGIRFILPMRFYNILPLGIAVFIVVLLYASPQERAMKASVDFEVFGRVRLLVPGP